MNTEHTAISALREVAYGDKLGHARKAAVGRFEAALAAPVAWDMPRHPIQDGTSTRFSALGSISEGGRTYRVAVYEYAGGRLEASLWLLDGKDRRDQGDQVKPHLRAAAVAGYLEQRQAQRSAKRAEVLAAEAAASTPALVAAPPPCAPAGRVVAVHHVSPRDDVGVDKVLVAYVTVGLDLDDEAALEEAYRLTQNLHGSWSRGTEFEDGVPNGDFSPAIELAEPLKVVDGWTYGHRSSMTGDELELEGRRYRVAIVGFDAIAPATAAAA